MNQEKESNNAINLSKSFSGSSEKTPGEKQSAEYFFRPGTPKTIQWLIKYSGGLIKNEKQATYVLLVIVILTIFISGFLFFKVLSGPQIPRGALEQPEYGLPIKD